MYSGGCKGVCRKSLKDSTGAEQESCSWAGKRATGQAGRQELKMLKHCLTQRAPLEFHLPPALTHTLAHTHTQPHAVSYERKGKK